MKRIIVPALAFAGQESKEMTIDPLAAAPSYPKYANNFVPNTRPIWNSYACGNFPACKHVGSDKHFIKNFI